MRAIFIFIDGVGVSQQEYLNPCFDPSLVCFNFGNGQLPNGGIRKQLDATLGIEGLPQSATGQTTIYTGVNAAKLVGHHLTGFPNAVLRSLIAEQSIFNSLTGQGKKCLFANAFRPLFFTTPEVFARIKMSVTTEMNRLNGLKFNSLNDLINQRALYHDFTNSHLRSYGFNLPKYNAAQAAQILINAGSEYDLVVYEYFMTDFAGHSKDYSLALQELSKVDELILGVVERADLTETAVIVCSDHGNIEDMSRKSHTTNPAFFAYWGKNLESTETLNDLSDVRPFIEGIIRD